MDLIIVPGFPYLLSIFQAITALQTCAYSNIKRSPKQLKYTEPTALLLIFLIRRQTIK